MDISLTKKSDDIFHIISNYLSNRNLDLALNYFLLKNLPDSRNQDFRLFVKQARKHCIQSADSLAKNVVKNAKDLLPEPDMCIIPDSREYTFFLYPIEKHLYKIFSNVPVITPNMIHKSDTTILSANSNADQDKLVQNLIVKDLPKGFYENVILFDDCFASGSTSQAYQSVLSQNSCMFKDFHTCVFISKS